MYTVITFFYQVLSVLIRKIMEIIVKPKVLSAMQCYVIVRCSYILHLSFNPGYGRIRKLKAIDEEAAQFSG